MNDELIRHFFREGLEKGFSKEYVRDILLNKGYDYHKVNFIYNTMIMHAKERDFSSSASSQKISRLPIKPFILGGALVLLIFLTFFFLKQAPVSGVTGMAVQDAQGRFDEISQLNDKIEITKQDLTAQLEALKTTNLTLEEKNKKIEELTNQLGTLHASIEEEHAKVRELLWDLLKTLLKRGEEQAAKNS